MKVALREEDVLVIAEALRHARSGNYGDSYLRSFRELQERFDHLAYHTRIETARRRRLKRAVRLVPAGELPR